MNSNNNVILYNWFRWCIKHCAYNLNFPHKKLEIFMHIASYFIFAFKLIEIRIKIFDNKKRSCFFFKLLYCFPNFVLTFVLILNYHYVSLKWCDSYIYLSIIKSKNYIILSLRAFLVTNLYHVLHEDYNKSDIL